MKKVLGFVVVLVCGIQTAYADWSISSGEVTRVYSHNGAHVIRTTLTDGVCMPGAYWWSADDCWH